MNASATFQSKQAARHLAAMCKHFAHKVDASHDAKSGQVTFPFGQCDFSVINDELRFLATAPDQAKLVMVKDVITRHFERFAFRENPDLHWEDIQNETSA